MSGGHFNYAYSRVRDFAEELDRDLSNLLPDEYSNEVVRCLRLIQVNAANTAVLMREAEWLLSGDTGDDSFLRAVKDRLPPEQGATNSTPR